MRRNAQHAIAHKVPAAGDLVTDARDAPPLVAHAGARLRTGISVGNRHAHLFASLAAIHDALSAVVIKIGRLKELNPISLAVAPGVLAIALYLG
jgi:hypothetical protein